MKILRVNFPSSLCCLRAFSMLCPSACFFALTVKLSMLSSSQHDQVFWNPSGIALWIFDSQRGVLVMKNISRLCISIPIRIEMSPSDLLPSLRVPERVLDSPDPFRSVGILWLSFVFRQRYANALVQSAD